MESINTSKRKLNIFIDESGSQSPCGSRLTHDIERPQESFYIVSFVFHREYITSIKYFINNINSLCEKYNLKEHYIHFAPLIHGSDNFKNYTFDDILNIVYFFNDYFKQLDVSIFTIKIDKRLCKTEKQLLNRIVDEFENMLSNHSTYFNSATEFEIYYDGGQQIINNFINIIMNMENKAISRKNDVKPRDYVLLQVCDFICSMNTLNIKMQNNKLTRREESLFKDILRYKKEILNNLNDKKI